MAAPEDFEARLAAVEARVEEVAADAAAARHLAAVGDRDLADLAVTVDANRAAINALGAQTRARFDAVDRRVEQVDRRVERLEHRVETGFAEMEAGFARVRGALDATAAGQERIVALLDTLAARGDDR